MQFVGSVDLTRSASETSRTSSSRPGADSAEKLAKKMGDIFKKSTSSLLEAAKHHKSAAAATSKSEATEGPVAPEVQITVSSQSADNEIPVHHKSPGEYRYMYLVGQVAITTIQKYFVSG